MITRKHKLIKLKIKYEVIEMSKRLLVVALFSGIMISAAPLAGLAEETQLSIQVEEEVKKEPGFLGKSWLTIKGGAAQARLVVENAAKVDERIKRKDAEIKRFKLEIKKLNKEAAEKRFVSGLRLEEAKGCVGTLQEFLDSQVEGK